MSRHKYRIMQISKSITGLHSLSVRMPPGINRYLGTHLRAYSTTRAFLRVRQPCGEITHTIEFNIYLNRAGGACRDTIFAALAGHAVNEDPAVCPVFHFDWALPVLSNSPACLSEFSVTVPLSILASSLCLSFPAMTSTETFTLSLPVVLSTFI